MQNKRQLKKTFVLQKKSVAEDILLLVRSTWWLYFKEGVVGGFKMIKNATER